MKLLALTKVKQQTLREMGILHEHHRTRMRAQAILRLSQGLSLQQTTTSIVFISTNTGFKTAWPTLSVTFQPPC